MVCVKDIEVKIKSLEEEYAQKGREMVENYLQQEQLIKERNKLLGKNFYVYFVYVDGVVRYIGKGSGDRWKHAISGSSSVAELNRDHFSGKFIEVRICKDEWLTESRAFQVEADMIHTHLMGDEKSRGYYTHNKYPTLKMNKMCMGSLYNKVYPSGGEYIDTSLLKHSRRIVDSKDNNGMCMDKRNKVLSAVLKDEWDIYCSGGDNHQKIVRYAHDGGVEYVDQIEICWDGYTRVLLCGVS